MQEKKIRNTIVVPSSLKKFIKLSESFLKCSIPLINNIQIWLKYFSPNISSSMVDRSIVYTRTLSTHFLLFHSLQLAAAQFPAGYIRVHGIHGE